MSGYVYRGTGSDLYQQPPTQRRRVAQCGTDGGYYRHIRTLGEPACDACLAAHAQAENERRNNTWERRLARERALRRLGAIYADDLARLLAEELA